MSSQHTSTVIVDEKLVSLNLVRRRTPGSLGWCLWR
jgi:hypothetical protein